MSVEASPAAIYEPVDVTVPQQLHDDASRLKVSVDAAATAAPVSREPVLETPPPTHAAYEQAALCLAPRANKTRSAVAENEGEQTP